MERYQIELEGFPGEEVAFIKTMRLIGKISLADAAKVFTFASNSKHAVLVAGLDRRVAEYIAGEFSKVKIATAVKVSSIASPMICRPQADITYRFDALRNAVPVSSHA